MQSYLVSQVMEFMQKFVFQKLSRIMLIVFSGTIARFRTPMSLSFFCRWSFLETVDLGTVLVGLPRHYHFYFIYIFTLNLNVHRNLYNKSKSAPAILPKLFQDSLQKRTSTEKKQAHRRPEPS